MNKQSFRKISSAIFSFFIFREGLRTKKMERKGVERSRKLSKVNIACTAVLIVAIAIAFVSLGVVPVMAQEDEVTVTVNAPEYVEKGATFDVTIDVDYIMDFNMGLFDLSFDRDVVRVKSVEDGNIDGTTIPVEMWKVIERDTIRVLLSVPGVTGVNGSGYLAKISFKVKSDEGDACVLDIENGLLGNNTAVEIPAEWIDFDEDCYPLMNGFEKYVAPTENKV